MIRHAAPLRLALLLGALAITACGPSGGPTTKGRAPGQPCARVSDCQGGLICDATQKLCQYARCEDAPDPAVFCAEALSLSAAQVRCAEGVCEQLLGQIGDPCAGDAACRFGLICEGAACVDTCTSSASCRAEGTACLPRPAGSGTRSASFCQPSPGCGAVADPGAFCADALGVAPEDTSCDASGACLYKKYGADEPCTRDGQCDAGLVCEDDLCTPSCVEGAACDDPDAQCLARTSGRDGQVCRQPSCAEVEDGDALCVLEYGEGWACDRLSRTCEPTEIETSGVYAVVIEDTSEGAACDATVSGLRAPGTDLTHITLRDPDGLPRAYGYLVSLDAGGEGNDFLTASILDGEPAALDGMQCPVADQGARFRQDNILSLGCGGGALVVFLGAGGEPLAIESGDQLEIGAFGPTCASAEEPAQDDRYRLRLCPDERALLDGNLNDCSLRVADDLTGVTTTTIDLEALGLTPESTP